MLVQTLRELGLGIKPITQILRQQTTLAQAAVTHIAAIEARISELRLQRAVLRVVVRQGANEKETLVMQQLLQASASERRRIVEAFVQRAFEGIDPKAPGAMIANAMRSVPPELPDEPSDVQAEAWLELLHMLNDQNFAARVREMAVAGAAQTVPAQPVDMAAIREHAQAALDAGMSPDHAAAEAVLDRIIPGMPHGERVQLRKHLEMFNDVRVERYWELMGVLNERPAFPKLARALDWFIAALRAREA